jgi:hypothetical protein
MSIKGGWCGLKITTKDCQALEIRRIFHEGS